jgi:phenylalanyl-tRNA synthetase beta chain
LFTAYRRVRDVLVAEGLHEVRPLPFTAGTADDTSTLVRVTNPLAEDEPYLRARVLDTLARRAEYNLNRMQGNVRLFEIGAVFRSQGTSLPREAQHVGALLMGARRPVHFSEPQPPAFDAWDAKALAEVMAKAAHPTATIELVSGEGSVLWRVEVDGVAIGTVERVALDAPVWAKPAFGVELALAVMPNEPVAKAGANAHESATAGATRREPVRYRALPTTPAAEFDLALLVPDAVPAAEVERVIREVSGAQLERLELFDEFRGTGVPDGVRSLAWRLTFRHPERTLRDKEIEGRRVLLLKTVEAQLGVRARTS